MSGCGDCVRRHMNYIQDPVYADLISKMLSVAVRSPAGLDMIQIALEAVRETVEEERKQLSLCFVN